MPAHKVAADPALTVAAGFMVSSTELVIIPQGPAGSFVLRVNVIVPLLLAIGVKRTEDGFAVPVVLLN